MPKIFNRRGVDGLNFYQLFHLLKECPHFVFSSTDKDRMGEMGAYFETSGILKIKSCNAEFIKCPDHEFCNGYGIVLNFEGEFFIDCTECGVRPLHDLNHLKTWLFDIETFLHSIANKLGIATPRGKPIRPDKEINRWILGKKNNKTVYFSLDLEIADDTGIYLLPTLEQANGLQNAIALEDLVEFTSKGIRINKKLFNTRFKGERISFNDSTGDIEIDGEMKANLSSRPVLFAFFKILWRNKGKVVTYQVIKKYVEENSSSIASQPPQQFCQSLKLEIGKLIRDLKSFIKSGKTVTKENGYKIDV